MPESTKRTDSKQHKNYLVRDIELLYHLSDAGLLDKLRGVGKDRDDPNKRIWFFDRVPDVKEAIDQFAKEKQS